MPCAIVTPADALAAALACAQAALAATPGLGIPDIIVVGGEGAGDAYTCCDTGLLTIEQTTLQPRDPELDTTSGSGPCLEVWLMDVTIGVRRCVRTFDVNGGWTDGSPVDPDVRSAASLAIAGEAWWLLQQLRCCTRAAWRGCGVRIVSQRLIPPTGGCFGHDTVLQFGIRLCCT